MMGWGALEEAELCPGRDQEAGTEAQWVLRRQHKALAQARWLRCRGMFAELRAESRGRGAGLVCRTLSSLLSLGTVQCLDGQETMTRGLPSRHLEWTSSLKVGIEGVGWVHGTWGTPTSR